MPEVTEQGKSVFKRMMSLFRGDGQADSIGQTSSSSDLLSGIYKLLVKRETIKVSDDKDRELQQRQEEKELEKRHKEILKALTVKRPAKKKIEKKIQEKTEKPVKPRGTSKESKTEMPSKDGAPKTEVPKTEAPKPEVRKTETPKTEAPAPKVETPTPTVPKTEAPKATATPAPAPKPPVTATPTTTQPSLPAATKLPSVGKAVSVITATTAVLAGKEALAKNIAKYESTASAGKSFGGDEYNAYNKGTSGNRIVPADKPIDFSKMTIEEYLRRGKLKSGDPDKLFAVGRYQIIPGTMESLVKQMNIDPKTTYLDPPTQDALFSRGLIGIKRKKVDDYLMGRNDDRDGAILELAKEFASIGIPYDIEIGGKKLKKGDSYYSGIGGNKAHNPPELVGAALDADRSSNLKLNNVTPDIGQNIDKKSVENTDMKKSLQEQSTTPQNVTNNISVGGSQEQQRKTGKVDDRSAFERKRTE